MSYRLGRYAVASVTATILALFIAGCSSTTEPVSTTVLTPTVIGQLMKAVNDSVASSTIPGASVFVRLENGETWTYTTGVKDLGTKEPITGGTHYRIGSLTKTLTATVILQLVDEGKLNLNATLDTMLPEVTVDSSSSITMTMLLNHSSGVPTYTDDDFVTDYLTNPTKTYTPGYLVSYANKLPRPFNPPGASWSYSNTNYILLGMIVEKITGDKLSHQIQTRIFDKLGMSNSVFPDDLTQPADMTSGYIDWRLAVPELGDTAEVPVFSPTSSWAAGAVMSTLSDLTIWADELATGTKLLSPATEKLRQRLFYINQAPYDPIPGYGLGILNVGGWLGHKGEITGWSVVPYRKNGKGLVVVMTNKFLFGAETGTNPGPASRVFNAVSSILFNEQPPLAPEPAHGK